MSSPIFYIHGEFVSQERAVLSVLDLGLLRGFAVFDFLRTYQGRPFHLDEHLLRLRYSAEEVGLTLPKPLEEIKEIVLETVRRNALEEAGIKIVISGGISKDQLTPSSHTSLFVLVYPLSVPPAEDYRDGISVITTPLVRSFPTSKTTNYLPGIVSLQRNTLHPAKEVLYLNASKEILEGSITNFFAFKEGVLYTADSDELLFGITRQIVLKLSPFPCQMTPIRYEEIPLLEEAFITSSSKDILPVVAIDGQPIGSSQVGPKTKALMALFSAYTQLTFWPALSIPRHEPIHYQHLT